MEFNLNHEPYNKSYEFMNDEEFKELQTFLDDSTSNLREPGHKQENQDKFVLFKEKFEVLKNKYLNYDLDDQKFKFLVKFIHQNLIRFESLGISIYRSQQDELLRKVDMTIQEVLGYQKYEKIIKT